MHIKFQLQYHHVLAAGLLGALTMSIGIWVPYVAFPFVPVLSVFKFHSLVPHIVLVTFLVVSAVWFAVKPNKINIAAILICIAIGWAFNLNTLRPDFYQFAILFFIALLVPVDSIKFKDAARLIHAAVYLWGGLLKINSRMFANMQFSNTFLGDWLNPTSLKALLVVLIIVEILIGVMFLLNRKVKWTFAASVLLHAIILVQLISMGWNEAMVPYNIFLVAGNYFLFIKDQPSISPYKLVMGRRAPFAINFAAIVYLCLPALNIVNLWPHYMSGSLYSSRAPFAIIYMMGEDKKLLPLEAQKFIIKSGNYEYLDFRWWMETETGCVPNPQGFVYWRLFNDITAKYPPCNKLQLYMY